MGFQNYLHDSVESGDLCAAKSGEKRDYAWDWLRRPGLGSGIPVAEAGRGRICARLLHHSYPLSRRIS